MKRLYAAIAALVGVIIAIPGFFGAVAWIGNQSDASAQTYINKVIAPPLKGFADQLEASNQKIGALEGAVADVGTEQKALAADVKDQLGKLSDELQIVIQGQTAERSQSVVEAASTETTKDDTAQISKELSAIRCMIAGLDPSAAPDPACP